MKKFLFLFLTALLPAGGSWAQDGARRIYEELRRLHGGELAAKAFSARLTEASARRLLRDKIPGKGWYVQVDYSQYTGLSLRVMGAESFYQGALSQYEQHINEMLLPLLSTRGYERFKEGFSFSTPREGFLAVAFKKGDTASEYVFQVGETGLIRRLDYYEGKSRKYAVAVQWKPVEGVLVPASVKAVSYEGSRTAGDFELQEIKITEK